MLNPFAPHITEELWKQIGNKPFLSVRPWPQFDPAHLQESEIEIAIQVNGKVRGRIKVPADAPKETLKKAAMELPAVRKEIESKKVVKSIVVPKRLVNIVVA